MSVSYYQNIGFNVHTLCWFLRSCLNITRVVIVVLAIRQCAAWPSTLITHKHSQKNTEIHPYFLRWNSQACLCPIIKILALIFTFRVDFFDRAFILLVLLLLCLPSDNVHHDLQRWSLISISDIRKPYVVLSQEAHHQIGITSRTGLLSTNERSEVPYHIKEVGRLACPLIRLIVTTVGRYLGVPDLHDENLGERASRAHRRDHRCFLILYVEQQLCGCFLFIGCICFATPLQLTRFMRKPVL